MECQSSKKRNSSVIRPTSTTRNKPYCTKQKSVFIRNIPFAIEENDLKKHFRSTCNVTGCKILKDADGKSRGCGFVDFATVEDAEKALSFDGSKIQGRKIKVEMKRGRPNPEKGKSKGSAQDKEKQSRAMPVASENDRCSLWIGSYPQTATEPKVSRHISGLFGEFVVATRLVRKPWGNYGIATFDTQDNATCAYHSMSKNKPFFCGIRLQVHDKPVRNVDKEEEEAGNISSRPVPIQDDTPHHSTVQEKPKNPAVPPALSQCKICNGSTKQASKPSVVATDCVQTHVSATSARSLVSVPSDSCRTVVIGEFPLSVREDNLKAYFSKRFAGSAIAVDIARTFSGNSIKVTFASATDAQKTRTDVDNTRILGTLVKVYLSRAKTSNQNTLTSPKVDNKPTCLSTPPSQGKNASSMFPIEHTPNRELPRCDRTKVKETTQNQPSLKRTTVAPRVPPIKPKPNMEPKLPQSDGTKAGEPAQGRCAHPSSSIGVGIGGGGFLGSSSLPSQGTSKSSPEIKNHEENKVNELSKDQPGQTASASGHCEVWIGEFPETTRDHHLKAYLSKLFLSHVTLTRIIPSSSGKYGVGSFDMTVDEARGYFLCLGIGDGYHLGSYVQVRLQRVDTGTGTSLDQALPPVSPRCSPMPPVPPRRASPPPTIQQTRTYSHSDPLITKLMCTKLLKQIKEIAEPLHVQVTSSSVCDSLTLVGAKEAVASVDRQLATKSKEVEDSLIETVVDVDSARVTAIPEESLKAQLSCLEQERTVRITVKKSTVKETQASRSNICKLQVVKGSLSDEVADAIVCPITADFLPQPGLTNDAIRAGGKALQEEIRRYQNVCGALKATAAFDLPAGDLKACMAILVVMPKPILPGRLSSLLGDFDSDFLASIKNILSVAERLQVRSLSLPVLGKRDCMSRKKLARLMTSAVKEYVLKSDNSALNCVRILTLDEEEIEEFRKAMPVHEVETGQAQSMTPTYRIIKRGQWMYEEDTGRYKPFDSASNAILEEKYVHSAAQAVVSIGSFTYKIDFSKMTQINKKTGKCRKLQRVDMSPANKSYQWAYCGDDGKFYNYDDGSNSILEDAWKDGRMVTFLTVNSHAYRAELDKWTQMNVSTRTRRSIQRLAIANLADSGRSPLTTAKNASESEPYGHQFTVKGQSEDVAVAASKLEAILQVERSSKCFSVPSSVYEEFRQEIDIQTRRFQVKVKRRSREETSVKIELEGISSLVDCAIQAIQQSIIARQTKSGIMSTSRPSEWDPQDDNTKLKMVTVSPASREFGVVKSKMAKTMPSIRVRHIQRIQNLWLWRKYLNHKQSMMEKNKGKVNEKELFHGSKYTKPAEIYDNEEGFDMRFSRQGLWGQGCYFAEDARYSHDYAFTCPNGERQMFLATVLTGDSANISPDSDLRMPPRKTSILSGDKTRYDSVTGVTMNSRIYVTYNNDKSYPLYLITYATA